MVRIANLVKKWYNRGIMKVSKIVGMTIRIIMGAPFMIGGVALTVYYLATINTKSTNWFSIVSHGVSAGIMLFCIGAGIALGINLSKSLQPKPDAWTKRWKQL